MINYNVEKYQINLLGFVNPIKLVELCWNCGYDRDEEKTKNCVWCNGSGIIVTENGKAILDFMKDFGK